MINWYASKDLKILFSDYPDTDLKKILPNMDKEEIESIEKKPLILNNNIFCRIVYKKVGYGFKIHAGYDWDGATIPSFAWAIIGSKLDPKYQIASLIHDNLCEHHGYVRNNRYLSTLVFNALLEVAKVNPLKRFTMKHLVDNFQKLYWRQDKNANNISE